MSPRADDFEKAFFSVGEKQEQTPRYSLGKNAYALAFGSSDLSKVLVSHDHKPQNPVDGLMKKTINGDDGRQKQDVVVPRDFLIKTAYKRKRRNIHTAADAQSTRSSKHSQAINLFNKPV